jgi:hypothetical protein
MRARTSVAGARVHTLRFFGHRQNTKENAHSPHNRAVIDGHQNWDKKGNLDKSDAYKWVQ